MTAPERIYLQWIEDDALPYIPEGVTWFADKIEDDDVEYVRADVARATPADHSDDCAVDKFAHLMKQKMAASRAKGRGGWNDPNVCSVESLSAMLHEHVAKGDPVDVANFCMMLRHYDAKIVQAPQPEAQSMRDAGPAIPDGWRFYSADFSINAKDSRYNGNVMLIRNLAGRSHWAALSSEDQERIDLYVQGKGLTFDAALADACETALKSAPPQKPVSDEVKP